MNLVPIFVCTLLGLGISWALIPIILKRSVPPEGNDRAHTFHHTHKTPVSRFGGVALALAFVAVVLVALIWFPDSATSMRSRIVIVFGSLAMFLLGLRDDIRPLGARKKLAGQILIASAACALGVNVENFQNPFTHEVHALGWWGPVFTVFWLVALTNMINLIDGIDGLAAGVALMLMGLLAYVGLGSAVHFAVLCAAGTFGALLGFLRYNFPPARIYLGDGGAYFLGFLIAILALVNSHKGTVVAALVAPLFALALPIVDVCLAILRRGLKGLPIFRPDRRHIHHKILELGVSRRRAVLILYALSSVFLLMAFAAFLSQGRLVPILFGFMCLTLLLSAGSFSFSREWFSLGRVLENSREMRKETQYALALGRWLEMEAERGESPESLWEDFVFAARKLGFCSVRFGVANAERMWREDETVSDAEVMHHARQIDSRDPMALCFCAKHTVMSQRVFEHLAELTAEFWHKAIVRWQQANGCEFHLGQQPDDLLPMASRSPASRTTGIRTIPKSA